MKVSIIGMGKIGYSYGICMALKGHDVMGYDINPDVMTYNPRPYKEFGLDGTGDLNDLIKMVMPIAGGKGSLRFAEDMSEAVKHGDIVFVTTQTPHHPDFEGVTRIPEDRVDFDYTYLIAAMEEISACVTKSTPVAIMSTVLPGTVENYLKPVVNNNVKIVYQPVFIAMGSTIRDFFNPEFVLLGVDDEQAAQTLKEFYYFLLGDVPIREMSVASAELTKVAYNTFIGMKIVFANNLMEICHKIPNANVDDVTNALKSAHNRLISPAYLSGGMGDGGGCHPRDNIALSWLSRTLDLSTDICEDIMLAREDQARFLCNLMIENHWNLWSEEDCDETIFELPMLILGTAFKPETNIETGSPALLCKNILEENGYTVDTYDPFNDDGDDGLSYVGTGGFHQGMEVHLGLHPARAQVILIGTKHEQFTRWYWNFPKGSIVIDPFRYIEDQEGVTVIRVGE